MAAAKKKRGADLTDQNWDREEEEGSTEEAGIFQAASEEILSKRTFKKAKRRVAAGEGSTGAKANPFASFGGFGGDTAKATFNFGAKPIVTATPSEKKSENNNTISSSFWQAPGENKDFFASRGEEKKTTKPEEEKKELLVNKETIEPKTMSDPTAATTDGASKDDYFDQLASLNHSVLAWIQKHVEKNPCIDLQPVFKDYEKHMKEIESKHSKKSVNGSQNTENKAFKTPDNNVHESPKVTAAVVKPIASVFASSTPIQGNIPSSVPSFKSGNLFGAASSPFTFKKSEPTTETQKPVEVKPPEQSSAAATTTDENDEADPVPERKTIVEDDAFHTIRCKLFYKKGSGWQELGIGMLYLKPGNDNKIQLLVRMENSTGKVLLNVSLSDDLPMSRSGKNNVMLVSVPNPPVYSKPSDGDNSLPCTYLIRVKGTTEADELLGKMKKS